MCGIFGLMGDYGEVEIGRMAGQGADRMRHRGPDGSGLFAVDGLALAHRRLSIFDLSDKGRQPLAYLHYVLVFNGAIYNFPELRERLKAAGYTFTTDCDTEVIPAAYDYWGADCVTHFNGMWAFAIYDARKREVFCSRDRFGIRPFYYWAYQGGLAFASEVKAFAVLPGWKGAVNQVRAYEFLAYGWQQHTEETMWAGVRQLPAGHNALYELGSGRFSMHRYYDLGVQPPPILPTSRAARAEGLADLLKDSLELRLRADVPVALSLSGGMDSSALAALSSDDLQAFTTAFPGTSIDESRYAQLMADAKGWPLHLETPSFEMLWGLIAQVCYQVDEPINSLAVVAHYQLMQQVKQSGYKVIISGQGADELLAGYEKFYRPHIKQLWAKGAIVPCLREVAGAAWLNRHQWRQAWPRYQAWRQPEAKRALPLARLEGMDGFIRPEEATVRACSLSLTYSIGLPERLLYEDKNSLGHGVESRVPFLDHRLAEYALALPDGDKIRWGVRKYLLRRALQHQLPKAITQRYRKLGFPTPQEQWIEAHAPRFQAAAEAAIAASPEYFGPNADKQLARVLRLRDRKGYAAVWRVVAFGAWRGNNSAI